jgi:hypothetical protein
MLSDFVKIVLCQYLSGLEFVISWILIMKDTYTYWYNIDSFTQHVLRFAFIYLHSYMARIYREIQIHGHVRYFTPFSWGEILWCAIMPLWQIRMCCRWENVAEHCSILTVSDSLLQTVLSNSWITADLNMVRTNTNHEPGLFCWYSN